MTIQSQSFMELTPEETQKINDAIQSLCDNLQTKLVQLKGEDRSGLLKIGPRMIGFVEAAIGYAEKNPSFLPGYFNMEEATKALEVMKKLGEIYNNLNTMTGMLEDTIASVGSDVYQSALSFYEIIKTAAKNRQPGAQRIYDDLKKWFPRSSGGKNPPNPVA